MNVQKSELSLSDIVSGILRSKKLIILSIVIGSFTGLIIAVLLYFSNLSHPTFSSKASMSINTKIEDGSYSAGSIKNNESPGKDDIYLSVYLRDTVTYIAESSRVYDYAVRDTHLKLSYEEFQDAITISQYKETQIITISVTYSNKDDTLFLLEKIMEVIPNALIDTMDIGSITPIENTFKVSEKPIKVDIFWLIVGAFLGAVISCNVSIVLVILQPTLTSEEDIRNNLELDTIGAIRHIEFTGKFKIQTVKNCAEAYLKLAYVFDYTANQNNIKTVLITSASAGEGKSTIASMLAMELVRKGRRVLIIDGNLRRPRIGSIFGIEGNEEHSLNHILSGKTAITDGLQEYMPNLCIFTAVAEEEPEINQIMGEVIENYQNEFDYILVDTPPIGSILDGYKMLYHIDSVLFVVKQRSTVKKFIASTIHELEKTGVSIMGCILNDVDNIKAAPAYASGLYQEEPEDFTSFFKTIKKRRKKKPMEEVKPDDEDNQDE